MTDEPRLNADNPAPPMNFPQRPTDTRWGQMVLRGTSCSPKRLEEGYVHIDFFLK